MRLTKTFTRLALGSAIMLASLGSAQAQEDEVKIGFIVKKPEQSWFINEQKAATEVGEELGFDVVRLGGEDGQEVLSAIDNPILKALRDLLFARRMCAWGQRL